MSLQVSAESSPSRLGDLIADIEQSHHVYTRHQLDLIADLFGDMAGAGMATSVTLQQCFDTLRDDLVPHLMKEERILFPYITALESDPAHPPHSCFGSIANPIRMMKIEHEHVKALLGQLRNLTSDFAVTGDGRIDVLYQALEGLEHDLQEHIHWEDEVLFPGALQLEREMAA